MYFVGFVCLSGELGQDAASLAETAAGKVESLSIQMALLKRTLSATQDATKSEQKMTAVLQHKLTASREVCEMRFGCWCD